MGVDLDVSGDFEVVDNKEDIDYYVRLTDETYADPIVVVDCLRRERRNQLQMGGNWMASADVTWHIWRENFLAALVAAGLDTSLVPKSMDKIIDEDGVEYMVQPNEFATWVTRYPVHTKVL